MSCFHLTFESFLYSLDPSPLSDVSFLLVCGLSFHSLNCVWLVLTIRVGATASHDLLCKYCHSHLQPRRSRQKRGGTGWRIVLAEPRKAAWCLRGGCWAQRKVTVTFLALWVQRSGSGVCPEKPPEGTVSRSASTSAPGEGGTSGSPPQGSLAGSNVLTAPSARSGEPFQLERPTDDLPAVTSHLCAPAGEGRVCTCPFLWGDSVSGEGGSLGRF